MYELLLDHGIWSDVGNWRECLEHQVTSKIEDAIRRKKRREQMDNAQKSGVNKLFSGKLMQGVFLSKEEKVRGKI